MSFPARYAGTCVECGQAIAVGDLIDWRSRAVVHAGGKCPDDPDLVVARPPCPRCFTVPAVSGACMCEDA